ncbi:unnamed protein product [Peronospora effusa]|nr:unnamed protein product [Peronospora effusa]
MGYGIDVKTKLKMKEKADVVEAIVGELVLKLHEPTINTEGYRVHLDTVVATMLRTHFRDQVQAEKGQDATRMTVKGPLSLGVNLFTCLPAEQLDETTGKVIVTNGTLFDTDDTNKTPYGNFLHEYKRDKEEETEGRVLPDYYTKRTCNTVENDKLVDKMSTINCIQVAMMQMDNNHILRTSREIFQVFKIYGMAVLSERTSLSLAVPHVSLKSQEHIKCSNIVTPARLTRQRQLILSVANLAACATRLGIAAPVGRDVDIDDDDDEQVAAWRLQEEHGLANTLRAFVGFHSAVAITSASAIRHSNELVDTICTALYDAAFPSRTESSASALRSSKIPEREPLMAMMQSVHEARLFMSSKTCESLHKQGERPVSDAALNRERNLSKSSLLFRQCGSNMLKDFLETQNKEQEAQQKETAFASPTRRKKRPKKKKLADSLAAKAGCITQNLERFLHRRFLFCLEEIVVLFAQHKTEACRAQITAFQHDLVPCVDELNFRKWEVSTSTLTLAMRDSFFRMLLHDICQFHAIISSSRNTRDGNRITQLRLPLHYTWANIDARVTSEQHALA